MRLCPYEWMAAAASRSAAGRAADQLRFWPPWGLWVGRCPCGPCGATGVARTSEDGRGRFYSGCSKRSGGRPQRGTRSKEHAEGRGVARSLTTLSGIKLLEIILLHIKQDCIVYYFPFSYEKGCEYWAPVQGLSAFSIELVHLERPVCMYTGSAAGTYFVCGEARTRNPAASPGRERYPGGETLPNYRDNDRAMERAPRAPHTTSPWPTRPRDGATLLTMVKKRERPTQ